MSQITLPLNDPWIDTLRAARGAADGPHPGASARIDPAFDAVAFEIGWDFAHHRLTPPADHLHGTHPVRQGWEAARAAFGARTLKPTRAVRQWLALRLQAWAQGLPFEGVMVTPRLLAQIDVARCPVTREPLTHGDDAPTDAVVVRVNAAAGYAAGNLAVVSRRAAQARGHADAATAQALAQRLGAGEITAAGGLDARAWQRWAALMRLTTPLPHARIACLPLAVLPPNRLRLLNPVHALQAVLTLLFTGEAYARRMMGLSALMPDVDARRQFSLFMSAMLARRLAVGWAADRQRVRDALEEAWAHPVIQRRWEQLALRLTAAECERIARVAAQRGLADGTRAAWRWLDDAQAVEGWALPGGGEGGAAGADAAVHRAPAPDDAGAAGIGFGLGADAGMAPRIVLPGAAMAAAPSAAVAASPVRPRRLASARGARLAARATA